LSVDLRSHVFVCTNIREEGHSRGCCSGKGSLELMTELKRTSRERGLDDVRINKSGCLNRCEKEPACVVYPDGVWYTIPKDNEGIEMILTHLAGGSPATDLVMGEEE